MGALSRRRLGCLLVLIRDAKLPNSRGVDVGGVLAAWFVAGNARCVDLLNLKWAPKDGPFPSHRPLLSGKAAQGTGRV